VRCLALTALAWRHPRSSLRMYTGIVQLIDVYIHKTVSCMYTSMLAGMIPNGLFRSSESE
jgi:hypothetical protein